MTDRYFSFSLLGVVIYYIKVYNGTGFVRTSFRPAPTARTSQARLCLQCWSQFWYTCLISLLLLIFYLSYQTYTLANTNGMALVALSQLARGKPLGPFSAHV